MERSESLQHTKWGFKYHVVWITKCRKNSMGNFGRICDEYFWELSKQKESEVIQGALKADHVHMMIWIPLNASFGWLKVFNLL